jgi:ABC-type multidrug transport system ATPase subunit
MSSLLEVDSITKSYKYPPVLTNIYFKCKTGDIAGILGRNGTGKSTLLKIIFGTVPAENKFIRIDGKIYDCPYKTKNLVCYLPQHDFLPKNFSVEKVIELYHGRSSIDTYFEDKFLQNSRKKRISYLSGGELRYLEIRILLDLDSKFLLLDEPFNGLSPIAVEHIKKLIIAASKTKGILLTDHDYRNVLDVANSYWLLRNGGIQLLTDKSQLVQWGYIPE